MVYQLPTRSWVWYSYKMKRSFLTLSILLLFAGGLIAEEKEEWDILKTIEYFNLGHWEDGWEISVKENELIYIKTEGPNPVLRTVLFTFGEGKFDIYLIDEFDDEYLVIYDDSLKRIYKSKLDHENIEFTQFDWDFGALRAIFKHCNDLRDNFGRNISQEIQQNYYLTQWNYFDREDGYKRKYLIGGGRADVYASDMAILNQNFQYQGDLGSLNMLFGKCLFYPKISKR